MEEKTTPKPASARRRVAQEVLDQIIKGLTNGELTVEQSRTIATETLATLEAIEKHEDLIIDFYKKLSETYPSFKLLYTRIKGEILKARELMDWKSALLAIEAGNVTEATEILTTAIEESANETTEFS